MEETNKILLSIVVPIFNVDKYLELCLDSLCKALLDVSSKQVICVNDGSTDNSLSIIKAFAEKYDFVECIDKENAGYGAAINSGMAAATGKYFTIVESDDCIIPEVYNDLLDKLENNPEADFIKTPYLVWVNGQVTNTMRLDDAPDEPFTAAEYPKALLFPPSIWSAIYRKSFLDEHDIHVIETPGASYQDTFFSTLLFLEGGRMLYHDEAYYLYRNDRLDASRHSKTKTTEIINIFAEIKEILIKKGKFSGQCEELYYAVYFKRFSWFFLRVREGYEEKVFELAHSRFIHHIKDKKSYCLLRGNLNKTERLLLLYLKNKDFKRFLSFSQNPNVLIKNFSFYKLHDEVINYINEKIINKKSKVFKCLNIVR